MDFGTELIIMRFTVNVSAVKLVTPILSTSGEHITGCNERPLELGTLLLPLVLISYSVYDCMRNYLRSSSEGDFLLL